MAAWLTSRLAGHTIQDIRLRSIAALKTYDPPITALLNETVTAVGRRGKYLSISAGEFHLVMHLSRAGWIRWKEQAGERKASQRGPLAAELFFDNGVLDITEQGHEKRLALWVVRSLEDVPHIAPLGPDALDPDLDEPTFSATIRGEGGTIKRVLADQRLITGIGNAYSDEILHAARVSPFTRMPSLKDDQIHILFETMKSVLGEAVGRSVGLSGPELKDEKRAGFRVHARAGQPCPICGDTIRAVWHGSRSFQYCPTCQTGGRVYADRRLSKLLK